MNLADYLNATDATAIYPDAGTGSITALTYVCLGLAGESAEVLEKSHFHARSGPCKENVTHDALVAELGDVSWYLARLHRELGVDPATTWAPCMAADSRTAHGDAAPEGLLVVSAGRVAETAKKALRDDASVLTPARRDRFTGLIGAVAQQWADTHHRHRLDPTQTLARNVAKLTDRASRGVLTGSGDHR